MKLEEANKQIDTYTGRASDNVRALAFAGLAFVWIVASQSLAGVRGDLFLAAVLLLAALFADFAHYLVGALIWDRLVRVFEREHPDADGGAEFTHQDRDIAPIYVAWYIKLGLIIGAYLVLAFAAVTRLTSGGAQGQGSKPAAVVSIAGPVSVVVKPEPAPASTVAQSSDLGMPAPNLDPVAAQSQNAK